MVKLKKKGRKNKVQTRGWFLMFARNDGENKQTNKHFSFFPPPLSLGSQNLPPPKKAFKKIFYFWGGGNRLSLGQFFRVVKPY